MNKKGISLIEIIISIAFLSLVLTAFLGLVTKAHEKDLQSQVKLEALYQAKNIMEIGRNAENIDAFIQQIVKVAVKDNDNYLGTFKIGDKELEWIMTIKPLSNSFNNVSITIEVKDENESIVLLSTHQTWIGGTIYE